MIHRIFWIWFLSLSVALASIGSCFSQAIPSGPRLRELAPPDFAVGGVMHGYSSSFNFQAYRQTASREFNAITATAFMPYGPWNDGVQPIDASGLIRVADWAMSNGMRVHAHPLIYPTENVHCRWLQALPNNQVEPKLRQYINTMAGSVAGKIWVWDVVNEVIGDEGDVMDADGVRLGDLREGGLKPYKEYQAMGQDYIAKAFRWAREADPNALLIINEYASEELNAKSDRLFAFCKKLRNAGVPIDGVGFQHHWIDTRGEPNYESIRANMQRFADEGFKIFITEADVAGTISLDPIRNPPTGLQLERQKRIFKRLIELAVQQPACKSFLMWDFVDDQSWLQGTDRPLLYNIIPPGAYMFGTIFWGGDSGGRNPIVAKNAYYGLQEALSVPFFGPYRITSDWESSTSYLARGGSANASGVWAPGSSVYLNPLNNSSRDWSSLKWTLERSSLGTYRFHSEWGPSNGCLSRAGTQNSQGTWNAASSLTLMSSNVSYSSQVWGLIPLFDGGYTVINGWNPGDGVLTRDAGGMNGQGQYFPGSGVRLFPPADWSSQVWYFERTR